jgi:hypothetical protein
MAIVVNKCQMNQIVSQAKMSVSVQDAQIGATRTNVQTQPQLVAGNNSNQIRAEIPLLAEGFAIN